MAPSVANSKSKNNLKKISNLEMKNFKKDLQNFENLLKKILNMLKKILQTK